MGIRLTKEHSSIIKDQVKLVGIYIKSIIDRAASTSNKRIHIMVQEGNDYVIIKLFLTFANKSTTDPDRYKTNIQYYDDFKEFVRQLYFGYVGSLINANNSWRLGFEFRIREDTFQICEAKVAAIPRKGVERSSTNRINVMKPNPNYDSRPLAPGEYRPGKFQPELIPKTVRELTKETYPHYYASLRVSVTRKGIWHFNKYRNGRIAKVINIKNFYTFNTRVLHFIESLSYEAGLSYSDFIVPFVKMCSAAYKVQNSIIGNGHDENMIDFAAGVHDTIVSSWEFNSNVEEGTKVLNGVIKISVIDADTNKVTKHLISLLSHNKRLTARFRTNLTILFKILMIKYSKPTMKLIVYLIQLSAEVREEDVPLFNERLITLYRKLRVIVPKIVKDPHPDISPVAHAVLDVISDQHVMNITEPDNYKDTISMARKLGRGVILNNLTPKRIEKYHDRLSRETRLLNMGPVEPKLDEYPGMKEDMGNKKYSMTLIDSKEALADESAKLRHCVHNYASNITRGQCLIYSVAYEGKRYTLQINKKKTVYTERPISGANLTHVSDLHKKEKIEYYIAQFKGFSNCAAPSELHELVKYDLNRAAYQGKGTIKYNVTTSESDVRVAF